MTFWMSRFRSVALLLASLVLGGCLPSGQSQLDEEKEPHFLAGKSRVNAMDYRGAIESFEKALEANPRSAAAHFELGILFEKQETDPAAAIYHYGEYLKLRPKAENAEIVKQHVMSCKQELARTVYLGPVTEKQQRDLEKLVEENKRLNEEVAKWRAYYASRPAGSTNLAGGPPVPTRLSGPLASGQPVPASAVPPNLTSTTQQGTATVARTHTVRAGQTPVVIARQYGVKVEALMAANPGLDARRLRPGQTLNIPSP